MIRVSSIESNWKGTPSVPVWTATLGQATVLTGPNGGGKSKVCEAIELALTGRVSQFAGRKSVKDPKTLWRAKPKGKGGLFIELTLSDGRTVRWQQDRSNGKPRQTIDGELWVGQAGETPWTGLGTVFGVAEVRNNLFGSPATAEKWLSTELGVTTQEILASIGEKAKENPYLWSLIQPFANSDSPGALVDSLKKRMRASKAEADTAQKLVDELEHVSGSPVTDAELAQAQQAVDRARDGWNEAATAIDQQKLLAEVHAEFLRARDELASLPGDTLTAEIAGVATARSIIAALNSAVLNFPNNTLCPCCHKELDEGVVSIHKRLKQLSDYVGSAEEARNTIDRRKVLTTTMEQAKTQGEALNSELQAKGNRNWTEEKEVRGLAVESAKAFLDELQRRRIATQAPGIAKATVDRAVQAHEGYKQAAKMVEDLLTERVEEAVDEFNVALAKIYPEHFGKPVLTLRPQVAVGVERDGVVGAPSGGEESVLLLAIATVVAYLRGSAGVNLLVMEDRAIDDYTLQAILDNWNDCEYAQVFIPTTNNPPKTVEGWSYVYCLRTSQEDEEVVTPDTPSKVDPFEAHPS